MCFGKKADDPSSKKNEEIEKMLRSDKKKLDKEVKILLLGAGESGKSTVLKQMKLIHADGFSPEDRRQWRSIIFGNLVQAFQVVLRAMDEQGARLSDPSNEKYINLIKSEPEIGTNEPLPMECLEAFQALWNDNAAQKAIQHGNEYALHDNLSFFFGDIQRLFNRDYIPTDQDILRGRLRTTGINETIFDLGSLTYRMFDVGGQRSERKKWIHVFDNVHVVLFLVAISGYDHVLIEDQNGNQMHEALMLFDTIGNSKWFSNSALILFLNKVDLFREKIESGKAPIAKHFPDYDGPPTDVAQGQEFFANKFRKLVKTPGKEPYIHYTNATDTDLLKKTMASVQDMIVQRNLHKLVL